MLSSLEREVLSAYLDGKSYQEIAQELDRHVKSIDNALQRVKRKLEKFLAENGGESVLRARMIELGYVEPKLQVTFDNPLEPTKPYRVDLLSIRSDGTMVAIELDGRHKYTDAEFMNGKDTVEVLLDERQREAALSSLGLEIMRIRWPDLLDSAKLSSIMNAYRIPTARQLGH